MSSSSVPPLPESFAAESARSTDSGTLPQRPARRRVEKPAQVPRLDFSKLKDQLEDDEDEDDMDGEGHDDDNYEDDDLDEQDMQAHGKVNRDPQIGDCEDDEDACWPSFERCSIREAGHICHPPAKAIGRPQNPVGYDDDDDLPDLPEGLSRHS